MVQVVKHFDFAIYVGQFWNRRLFYGETFCFLYYLKVKILKGNELFCPILTSHDCIVQLESSYHLQELKHYKLGIIDFKKTKWLVKKEYECRCSLLFIFIFIMIGLEYFLYEFSVVSQRRQSKLYLINFIVL